jgi:hypothetical protein
MFASTPGKGIFFSSDMGDSWTSKNNNLQNLDIRAMLIEGILFMLVLMVSEFSYQRIMVKVGIHQNNGLILMHILV